MCVCLPLPLCEGLTVQVNKWGDGHCVLTFLMRQGGEGNPQTPEGWAGVKKVGFWVSRVYSATYCCVCLEETLK